MTKLQKKHKKGAGRKELMLRHTCHITTAVYDSRKSKPLFSVSAHGDLKIPVWKLALIALAALSALTVLILSLRALIVSLRRKRAAEEEEDCFCDFENDYEDDEELPF